MLPDRGRGSVGGVALGRALSAWSRYCLRSGPWRTAVTEEAVVRMNLRVGDFARNSLETSLVCMWCLQISLYDGIKLFPQLNSQAAASSPQNQPLR